jgi:hypothetical protein
LLYKKLKLINGRQQKAHIPFFGDKPRLVVKQVVFGRLNPYLRDKHKTIYLKIGRKRMGNNRTAKALEPSFVVEDFTV